MKGEQITMNLDTQLEVIIKDTAINAISKVRQDALANMIHVRNRHEAYGIAAENFVEVTGAIKAIKNDVAALLDTLPDPNRPAVEATSAIRNSAETLVVSGIKMAAVMERVLRDLYDAEEGVTVPEPFPMEDYVNDGFEEAKSTDDDE